MIHRNRTFHAMLYICPLDKCDGSHPCDQCSARGVECQYTGATRRRHTRPEVAAALEAYTLALARTVIHEFGGSLPQLPRALKTENVGIALAKLRSVSRAVPGGAARGKLPFGSNADASDEEEDEDSDVPSNDFDPLAALVDRIVNDQNMAALQQPHGTSSSLGDVHEQQNLSQHVDDAADWPLTLVSKRARHEHGSTDSLPAHNLDLVSAQDMTSALRDALSRVQHYQGVEKDVEGGAQQEQWDAGVTVAPAVEVLSRQSSPVLSPLFPATLVEHIRDSEESAMSMCEIEARPELYVAKMRVPCVAAFTWFTCPLSTPPGLTTFSRTAYAPSSGSSITKTFSENWYL